MKSIKNQIGLQIEGWKTIMVIKKLGLPQMLLYLLGLTILQGLPYPVKSLCNLRSFVLLGFKPFLVQKKKMKKLLTVTRLSIYERGNLS